MMKSKKKQLKYQKQKKTYLVDGLIRQTCESDNTS